MKLKSIYTSGEAAAALGVPARTIRRYLSNGRLPGKQNPITGRWVVPHDVLTAFMSQHATSQVTPIEKPLRIVMIGADPEAEGIFERGVRAVVGERLIDVIAGGLDLLFGLADKRPEMLVVAAEAAGPNVHELLSGVRRTRWGERLKIFVIARSNGASNGAGYQGVDGVLHLPLSEEIVSDLILSLSDDKEGKMVAP